MLFLGFISGEQIRCQAKYTETLKTKSRFTNKYPELVASMRGFRRHITIYIYIQVSRVPRIIQQGWVTGCGAGRGETGLLSFGQIPHLDMASFRLYGLAGWACWAGWLG